MKTLSYTRVAPEKSGMYWFLEDTDGQPKIVRVYQDAQKAWSVQYDSLQYRPPASTLFGDMDESDDPEDIMMGFVGTDFIENWKGFWAGPIVPPVVPKIEIEEEKGD